MVYNRTKKYHTIFRKLGFLDPFYINHDTTGPAIKETRTSYRVNAASGGTSTDVATNVAVIRYEPPIAVH